MSNRMSRRQLRDARPRACRLRGIVWQPPCGGGMSRILIHEPDPNHDDSFTPLGRVNEDVVMCRDRNALVRALAAGRPDLLLYVLVDLVADLGLLRELRRLAPTLPIILLGGPTD